MFEKLTSPQEAYNYKLGAALKMERTILGMLDNLIEEANEEELRNAFREHQTETRGHVANVEAAFAACGWEPDESPCPTIEAIEKEGKANAKKTDDSLVDSVLVGGAMETEHHEMAVYEYLIVGARAMGRDDVVRLLEANLEDERNALAQVSALGERFSTASAAAHAGASR